MNEHEILINGIETWQNDEGYSDFDELVITQFFSESIDVGDLSRLKTDSYGDAGIDYIFTTCNRNQFYEFEDLEELLDLNVRSKNNIIDLYFLQIKDSPKLDSNVPNKFNEFADSLIQGKVKDHYNEEINEFITLYTNILKKYVTKMKIDFHFYYFSKASKQSLQDATDLKGRFDTLETKINELDFCNECKTYIKGCSDIYNKITADTCFEYTFKEIEKFETELENVENKTNAVIALIPLKEYYSFLLSEENEIRDKLFESNIRDFKGRSNVNNNISETLKNNVENTDNSFVEFWWLNNGVTITVEELNESKSQKQITITNPQIVNGLQTSYSIFNYFKDNLEQLEKEKRKIFIKILKIAPNEIDKELSIIVATNSQNEIRDKDIHANDIVQKNIEIYLKDKGKYYQRKDKYYTNRKLPKNDIVKLTDMAKYINTVFLRDPAFTRNNPGKLLKGSKYDDVFQTKNENQNYDRYYKVYLIYEQVINLYKGTVSIKGDEFARINFLQHIVYVSVILVTGRTDYSHDDVMSLNVELIDKELIDSAEEILLTVLSNEGTSNAKVLKEIKEQKFTRALRSHLKTLESET